MEATRNQRTIAAPVTIQGVGYWSGQDVRVEFRPAAPNEGIVFVRGDLPDSPRIAAIVANRVETPRRTVLRSGEASVEMIEHLMAALSGMQIDNCEVWVDQPEMPGCDGSCMPFVEALRTAGAVEQVAVRPQHIIRDLIRLGDEKSWIEARPCSSGKRVLRYELDYGASSPIGRQSLEVSFSPRHFHLNLAPSRTFLLEAEAEALKASGLGQRASVSDLLVFGSRGLIQNQLRFPDECVRHKLVDLVGDLSLAGCDLVGRFVAYRSGHRLNGELVRAIVEQQQKDALKRCA
ncbi:MAG: UDP-3-O-acyl-N-acetylglucosamine deacetylase [Planctomycetaceae bacterium]|nr:UDP-3-O-acyl-N-acetylglucosamine deacetylase [Planctomycetaceae bacterium]